VPNLGCGALEKGIVIIVVVIIIDTRTLALGRKWFDAKNFLD
jgi:hypothetical protein